MSTKVEPGGRFSLSGNSALAAIPEHAGPRLMIPRGGVVHSARPPETYTFRSSGDFVVVLLAPVKSFESRAPGGGVLTVDAPAGALAIAPAGIERSGGWASALESLIVGFEPGQLATLAEQELGLADLRLSLPGFGRVDEQALQIALLLRQELLSDAPNPLYADSLVTVLGLHVIRHYSNAGTTTRLIRSVGGLSLVAAQRVREFINANVGGKVTVAQLAALCDLSPTHFMRSFAKTFGVPPYQYLLNVRLALAVRLLTQTALPIADVAYLSGFSSQSHLTSAMRKYRQTTPAQVRAAGYS